MKMNVLTIFSSYYFLAPQKNKNKKQRQIKFSRQHSVWRTSKTTLPPAPLLQNQQTHFLALFF